MRSVDEAQSVIERVSDLIGEARETEEGAAKVSAADLESIFRSLVRLRDDVSRSAVITREGPW